MARNRVFTILVIGVCILFVVIGFMGRILPPGLPPRILPELDPLPALEVEPGYDQIQIEVDNVTLSAQVQFFIFMPHNGYNTFSFYLEINVTNEGPANIDDFNATKASVFFSNSTLLYTFGLLPFDYATIKVGEKRNLGYEADRDMPVVLGILGSEELYLRVVVTFNTDSAVILTTPLTYIQIAIE